MKKVFALILAVMMIATMSVTAFAAESPATNNGGDTAITVKGTYTGGDTASDVISVGIAWDAMEFTYNAGSEGTWNPTTHKYDNVVAAGWSTDTATITVTNHSNVAVTATLKWEKNTALTGTITGTFTETSGTENDSVLALATAVGTAYDAAPSASAEFGISGDAITASGDLGTITVTIAKATN